MRKNAWKSLPDYIHSLPTNGLSRFMTLRPPGPERLEHIRNICSKNIHSKTKNKSDLSSYQRKNQIFSLQENSLMFFQTINIVDIGKHTFK